MSDIGKAFAALLEYQCSAPSTGELAEKLMLEKDPEVRRQIMEDANRKLDAAAAIFRVQTMRLTHSIGTLDITNEDLVCLQKQIEEDAKLKS